MPQRTLPMHLEVLRDAAELEEEWWDLWRRDPAATPFQSPAWLLPWRRRFPDGESAVLTIRRAGRLAGLLPLFKHDGRYLPWGAGTSDWLNGLFDPDLDAANVSAAMEVLSLPVDLFQMPAGSPLLAMPVPEGWADRSTAAESCAVLSLPARLGKKMAQNLRYYRRRAARAGAGEPRRNDVPDVDALAELHTRRWQERREPGIFSDARVLAWLREALPPLQQAGLLRFYTIEMGSRIVAALCVLCAKGRAFYYIGGFDPGHEALGLGTILVGHAIAEAEAEGCRSFDFLRGQEAYKYRWGAVDQPTYARRLVPPQRKAAA
jgi:CelD/BcsL family acetyltransferase involved in cellulose biosynthesis